MSRDRRGEAGRWVAQAVVLGHSVRDLCDEVAQLAPEVAERCPEWGALDQHYIATRYPDALPGGIPAQSYTEAQARDALATAGSALEFAHRRVST